MDIDNICAWYKHNKPTPIEELLRELEKQAAEYDNAKNVRTLAKMFITSCGMRDIDKFKHLASMDIVLKTALRDNIDISDLYKEVDKQFMEIKQ